MLHSITRLLEAFTFWCFAGRRLKPAAVLWFAVTVLKLVVYPCAILADHCGVGVEAHKRCGLAAHVLIQLAGFAACVRVCVRALITGLSRWPFVFASLSVPLPRTLLVVALDSLAHTICLWFVFMVYVYGRHDGLGWHTTVPMFIWLTVGALRRLLVQETCAFVISGFWLLLAHVLC